MIEIVFDIESQSLFFNQYCIWKCDIQKWRPVSTLKLLQNISIRNSFARVIEENNYEW